MNSKDKKLALLRLVVLCIACISGAFMAARTIIDIFYETEVPHPVIGTYHVFHTQIGPAAKITDIHITDDYIYLEYEQDTTIEVYNWNGQYIQSMSFYKTTNGAFYSRTDNNILYVRDYDHKEFVFSGTTLVDSTDDYHDFDFYTYQPETNLKIKGKNLYDENDSFIMKLPSRASNIILKERKESEGPFILITVAIIFIFALAIIIDKIISDKKEKRTRLK